MARHQTPQDILAAARQRNEDRLAAVERMVGEHGTRNGITAAVEAMSAAIAAARVKVEEAEAEDVKAYQDALKAGWTEAELRAVGIRSQTKPARPARASRGKPAPADVAGGLDALTRSQLEREARASTALDRDQTHVVGDPVGADT